MATFERGAEGAPMTRGGRAVARQPEVEVTSSFWRRYRKLVRDAVLPYQWSVINDEVAITVPADPAGNTFAVPKSGAVANLRIAAGRAEGEFSGFPFQDSDVYKWLEAVAYTLAVDDDEDLRAKADSLVELIAAAQTDDGYLDSYFQICCPERRFKRIQQSHELYCMGHYIEAGVAYHEAVGSELALEVARRMADCIGESFGPEEGKIHGSDGHPEIEIALARLYEVTGERRYLELAHWFLRVRGEDPEFYAKQNAADAEGDLFESMKNLPLTYFQAHEPLVRQEHIVGHAVRATYLLTAAAHVARLTDDEELADACERLWNDATERRMFVTGGVGSTRHGESFTFDYDLPNDTMYGETCASVAMTFWARRMLELKVRGVYGDVMERELYNGTISGMSLDGRHFYYVNPLEADPQASAGTPDKLHVLTRRAEWFGCACCPANLARLVMSVDRYLYDEREGGSTVLVDQYVSSRATFSNGARVEQESGFPWEGDVRVVASAPADAPLRLGLRVPAWAAERWLLADESGREVACEVRDGFAYVTVPAGSTRELRLSFPMRVRLVRASNRVRSDVGKVAVCRGPVVFCMEQADNEAPLWLDEVDLGRFDGVRYAYDGGLLGGVGTVSVPGVRESIDAKEGPLYQDVASGWPKLSEVDLRFVPYYAWANREDGQMQVWVRATEA